MSDRDAAARDTVYRAPAPRAAAGGSGKKKSSSGGGGGSGKKIPVPTPRPDPTPNGSMMLPVPPDTGPATTTPSAITPPIATQSPSNQPGFVPTGQPTGVLTGPNGPLLNPHAFPPFNPSLVGGPIQGGFPADLAPSPNPWQPGSPVDPRHQIAALQARVGGPAGAGNPAGTPAVTPPAQAGGDKRPWWQRALTGDL